MSTNDITAENAIDTEADTASTPITTDTFGQSVRHYDDPCYGAGETGVCDVCESQNIKLYAATSNPSNNQWEEFYRCDCGAKGSFVYNGQDDSLEWFGSMSYPEW